MAVKVGLFNIAVKSPHKFSQKDGGMTLVVSPLLALMKDQVAKLRDCGIDAFALTSETPIAEKNEVWSPLSG